MRVLMTLLLIAIAGCGEGDQDPPVERDVQRQSGRGNRDPIAAFAATCVLEDSATLHPPEHSTTTDPKLSH